MRQMDAFRSVIARFIAISLLAVTIAGCATDEPPQLQITSAEISGPGTLGLWVATKPVTGLVVYFHGMDQDSEVLRADDKHQVLSQALLENGFAVVSATADGNAFGNPASQTDYRELITAARAKFATDQVFFFAESMGGLPALMLMNDPQAGSVKAMAAVSPVMGLPVGPRSLDYVAGPWGGEVPPDADPMSWPVEHFAGDRFRLYLPDDDGLVPPGATGEDFKNRFGPAANVELERCEGGHVSEKCFDGSAVVDWFKSVG